MSTLPVAAQGPIAQASPPYLQAARRILDEASLVIAAIQNPDERVRQLLELARLQADLDDFAGAEQSMGVAQKLTETSGGLPQDQGTSFAWTAMAKAQVRAGRPQEALDALVRGWPGRRNPDVPDVAREFATRTIIEELARVNDPQAALAFALSAATSPREREQLRLLVARAQVERQDIQGALQTLAPLLASPEDDVANLAANLYGIQGNLAEAHRLADEIRSPSLQFETLLELPTYHALHGDIERARMLLAELLPGGGGHPTPEAIALPAVMAAQIAGGDLQGALTTAKMFSVLPDEAMALAIDLVVRTGDMAQAVRMFADLRPRQTPVAYAVATAQARSGDVDGALKVAEQEPDSRTRDSLVAAVAVAQAKGGDPAGAARTAMRISDVDIRDRARFDIALAQAAAGDATPLLTIIKAGDSRSLLGQLLGSVQRILEEDRAERRRLAGPIPLNLR